MQIFIITLQFVSSVLFKAIIDTLGNDTGEANHAVIQCCLFISQKGKELDYKYDQLVRGNFIGILFMTCLNRWRYW